MARKKGAVNYKNDVLIQIVGEILPNGEYGWQAVANAYQVAANEETIRDTTDLKKHWMKNLCNNMKKPTGRTGEVDDRIHRCISIEKKIMKKTHSGMMGFSSDDEDPIASGDDEFGRVAVLLNDSVESGDEEDDSIPVAVPVDPPPVPMPSPLRRSPRRAAILHSSSSSDAATGDINTQPPPAARIGASPSSSMKNKNSSGDDRTPPPSLNDDVIHSAMAKSSSRLITGKTKNSSNKNKERTSITGAIVKLIELQNHPASSVGESAAITLMRQMESINRSMDARDRREKKDRRKERKRKKKRRAKKRAKKRVKRAKMEERDEPGGAGKEDGTRQRSSSSSSSSGSSSDEDSSDSDSSGDESSQYGKGSWRHGVGGIVTVDGGGKTGE